MGCNDGTIVIAIGFIALLAFVLIREGQHQRIVRDLTVKLMARDLDDYKQVAESLPVKKVKVEEKKRKINDPVLGQNF